jgi:hypothetical protein
MSDDSEPRARATWLRARREWREWGGTITALEFGDAGSAIAVGAQSEPERVIRVSVGPGELARKYFRNARPGESAIESAIAEVEDLIMPMRPLVPRHSRCATGDPRVSRIAEVLQVPPEPWRCLRTDAVEQCFNRWVAIALGRPATQDTIPMDPEFAASLLLLREWLHHFSFENIRVA